MRDGSRGVELWEKVMEAGKPHNIKPIGPSDIRRIEAGILNFGIDMTISDNPYEVGLGRLVDLDKDADFIGREALERIKREGGEAPARRRRDRWTANRVQHDRLARVRRRRADGSLPRSTRPGCGRTSDTPWCQSIPHLWGRNSRPRSPRGARPARVVRKPFIDPGKEIPKA